MICARPNKKFLFEFFFGYTYYNTFWGKIFVGSRIRTYEPRCPRFEEPRSRILQEPQRVGGWDLIDLTRSLGARGFLGSGALDHSAIPTHVDSQILQEAYLAR